MSKKVILGTLLASATLLGAASISHAATSDIKAESKKVTVTTDKAKLYKDSKLKESTTPKKGTVYQVDGYRDINGKHVYRVYQTDKNNKAQYKGYIVNKDTKDLTSEKASDQFVAKKGATLWNNFYWNNKKAVTSEEKVYFAKYSYTLGDGAKYYSVYYKDKDGKDTWAGYTNAVNVSPLKATGETKYVILKKDYSTWQNLYFKQHKDDFTASKGVNFKVKRYYTLNGNKFYSTYRTDSNGKEVWTGYVNGYSSVVEDLKATDVKGDDQNVQVTKAYNTYKNHFFTKNGQVKVGDNVEVARYYTYGNGKHYASISDEKGNWLGYINTDAIASTTAMNEALPAAEDAIKKAEEILNKAQASTASKEAAQKAIDEAKKLVENPLVTNTDAIKAIPENIKKAMENLKAAATIADVQSLENAMKDAQEVVTNKDKYSLTNTEDVEKSLELAKKVLADAKKGTASAEDVTNATKAINDAIVKVGFDKTTLENAVKSLKDTVTNVYLTKAQEETLKSKITEAINKVEDDTVANVEDEKAALELINTAISDMNEKQPNKDDGEALNIAISNYDKLDKVAKSHLDWLFQDSGTVKSADEAANTILTELKKDPTDGTNTATTDETKEAVKAATDKLNNAMKDLSVNENNTKNFMNTVKAAIEKLDQADQTQSKADFDAMKEALTQDHTINNYKAIIEDAKKLVTDVDAAQDKELNAVIDKVKRIEGNDQQYKKYYDDTTYNAMNTELGKAETAEKLTVDKITKDTMNNKQKEEDALKEDIQALKVRDWDTTENNSTVTLTKYTGNAFTGGVFNKENSQNIVDVPAKLKDKNVALPDNGTVAGNLFGEKFLKDAPAEHPVAINFISQDGSKVATGERMYGSFGVNSNITSIDVAGLDSSNTMGWNATFMNDTNLTEIKNSANLITSKAKIMKKTFARTSLTTLDASNWDTSNVTTMEALFGKSNKLATVEGLEDWNVANVTTFKNMFGGTTAMTTLNLSKWDMAKATEQDVKQMFQVANYSDVPESPRKLGLQTIILPSETKAQKDAPKWVVKALEEVGKQNVTGGNNGSGLIHDVTVKTADGKVIGTVKTNGIWASHSNLSTYSIPEAEGKKGRALVQAVQTAVESEDELFTNSKTVANICNELDNYYKLVGIGTEEGYNKDNTDKVQNNRAFEELLADVPEAEKMLQAYAKDVDSVKGRILEEMDYNLAQDWKGIQSISQK